MSATEQQEIDLPTPYQSQIHRTKYARWREEDGRRETWPESVDRYLAAISRQAEKHNLSLTEVLPKLREAQLNLEVMGSMRMLATAGPALDRDHAAGYNCSFMYINRPQAFDETLFLLACGTGVGYSVERQYIRELPEVPDTLYPSDTVIVVPDSKIGWATSLRQLVHLLYSGVVPKWDTSRIRPQGAQLKTFGGKASGPGPLEDLFHYVVEVFREAQGRKLYSVECHGIQCKIADAIIAGGVRRSALICIFNPTDDRMLNAKSGEWWKLHPEYANANNSIVWTEQPDMERFIAKWTSVVVSKSGEPGIINREGMKKHIANMGRRDSNYEFGTNPCAEIMLRDRQMCNLSEVIVRSKDSYEDLARKVRLATVLGTIQSTFTDFRYLSSTWKKNCEEERLLGVSLTGIMDHPVLNGLVPPGNYGAFVNGDGPALSTLEAVLDSLKQVAIDTNLEWSEALGISPSAAITCVKPSGNNSQLCDCASGIHTRHSRFYIRTNRLSKLDPVAQFLRASGVPCEDDLAHPDNGWVFSYPIKAPEGAVTRTDVTALDQLNLWLTYAKYWCEHKPSVTISVREDEWLKVGAFVYEQFDQMSGVSFLPYTGHTYRQAPYQEITEKEYEELLTKMPRTLDWDQLAQFELEDHTTSAREFSCTANACEVL